MPDSFIRPGTLRNFFNGVAAVGAGLCVSSCAAIGSAPDNPAENFTPADLSTALNEKVITIPTQDGPLVAELETTIYKPPGEGPFPVVIMNHGKALGSPKLQGRDRFIVLSQEFVKRGYAVIVPMRKGFSNSTGQYSEYDCDMTRNGQKQADDVQSTLNYIATQPWADKNRVIVAGQSYGGLATMALGARNALPGVRGLINFGGGLKIHGGTCDWKASLVEAFSSYGEKTTVPSLWFYGANDSHFDPTLAVRLRDAYNHAGGKAHLIAFGPFKEDAHGLVASHDGPKIWWPETEKFLNQIGLPTQEIYAIVDEPQIPETKFAALDSIESVPNLHDGGRAAYRNFLKKSMPRAFAVAPDGAWAWAEDGDDPVNRALSLCEKTSRKKCTLYAVNDRVVWPAAPVMANIAPAANTPHPAPVPAGTVTGR